MKTHWSPDPGGQLPAHIGGVPGCATSWHGRVVVLVVTVVEVGTVCVVVVELTPTTCFSTGAQRITGFPTATLSSWPN